MNRGLRLLLAVAVLAGLTSCEASANGAWGSGSIRPGTLFEKKSKTVRTEATPTSPATEETTCEGGACRAPAPK